MQQTKTFKLAAVAVCAGAMWFGHAAIATPTVSADESQTAEATAEPSSSQSTTTSYTVQPGDYLEAIANQHQVNWPSIYEINEEIDNPDLIYPNQKLDIPSQDLPVTRSIAGLNRPISEGYVPQPSQPTRVAPQSVSQSTTPVGYASQQSPTNMSSTGIVGLSQVIGRPYVHGGTSLAGFDCSGLTQYLAGLRGISLPRTVAAQYHATRRIGQADLQPGDLVFFNWNHVGMYIGGGQIVHATNPAQGVRIDSLSVAIQYNGYLGAGALGR